MVTKPGILVLTPLFRQGLEKASVALGEGVNSVPFDPSRPADMLLVFRRLAEGDSSSLALVLDVGRFRDETPWAFVSDAVGRSGANPLRGLDRIMKEPFVDVTRLYHVPEGAAGVEVIALGDRYLEYRDQPLRDPQMRPACSHLHAAAILAHVEGLRASGIVVSESALPQFNIDRVAQL